MKYGLPMCFQQASLPFR